MNLISILLFFAAYILTQMYPDFDPLIYFFGGFYIHKIIEWIESFPRESYEN